MKSRCDAKNYLRIFSKSEFVSRLVASKLMQKSLSFRYKEDGEVKYLRSAMELQNPDRFTLEVNFEDVEKYNQFLSTAIIEEYYR
jgi:hypothetical protein